ncbi:MAG: ATP-grasp domain-containing protein [Candidatus Hodarchaeota archaeon]
MSPDLCIGFNSRPIVEALKRINRPVAAIDYFGDVDIRNSADYLFSILDQREDELIGRPMHRSAAEYLVSLAEVMSEEIEIEKVIVGSGLDDYPELWARLATLGELCGNDPNRLSLLRDREILYKKAKEFNIQTPEMKVVTSPKEAGEYSQQMSFPLVVKGSTGGGGSNTILCNTSIEVEKNVEETLEHCPSCYLLEFLRGFPASISLIGNGNECKTVAINKQLIGCDFAAAPSPFTYTGNISPFNLPFKQLKSIKEKFELLGESLYLKGSNGFDFILDKDNEPYILELNPRIQGTLESIELASEQSVIKMHLEAFEGELPEVSRFPHFCVKIVVFAPIHAKVPVITRKEARDRPIPGSLIQPGMPYCSILEVGSSEEKVLTEGKYKVSHILELLGKQSCELSQRG